MSKKRELSAYDIARIAAEAGAAAGVKAFEQEKQRAKQERVDRRLRNTRLLLQKYRVFKLHSQRAVFSFESEDDSYLTAYEILDEVAGFSDDLYIESIKRSAKRTAIIVKHIDTMLELYCAYCINSNRPEDMRHYRVVNALYIDQEQMQIKDVAALESIEIRTVYRDIDAAVDILSGLIFGIDSLGIA